MCDLCPVGVGDRLRFANPNDLEAVANNNSNNNPNTSPNNNSSSTANYHGDPDDRTHNNATPNHDSASLF